MLKLSLPGNCWTYRMSEELPTTICIHEGDLKIAAISPTRSFPGWLLPTMMILPPRVMLDRCSTILDLASSRS